MRGCVDVFDILMDIYTQRKKLFRGLRPPLSPWPTSLRFCRGLCHLQGTTPLNYCLIGFVWVCLGRAGWLAGRDLRAASNRHSIHKRCTINCARVSRRNDISEFFLEFTQDRVAHFHIELWVLKYIPSRENIQMNIGSH